MRFSYHENPALPRLAWCALFEPGVDAIRVHHGTGIETRPGFFVEGAWDGEFSQGRFDKAIVFTGTGARLVGDGVRFSSPSHNLERCYTLSRAGSLGVSNSLVFLVTAMGEQLDPAYPYYYFDYIRCYRTGLRQTGHGLRMLSGARIAFQDCHNFEVRQGRIVNRRLRNFGEPSHTYDSYRDQLLGTTARIFRNAADPMRRNRFRPLASISRGYDSPATSVLAAECGCTDALTFRKSNDTSSGEYTDDSGRDIAERLGLRCVELDRIDLRDADPELLKLHFQNPFGSIVSSMDQASGMLKESLFITGRHGEHFWGLDPTRCLPLYQEPTARKTLVQNTLEFRLSRGYIDFHLPYTGGMFAPDLLRLSRSPAMAKWRMGGEYDRPIPRRMVESAGIARDAFGMRKMGGANADPDRNRFSAEAREDFLEFYRRYVPRDIQLRQHERQVGRFGFHEHGVAHGLERRLRVLYGMRTISEYLLGFRSHQRRHSPYLYAFHWGFEEVARRYRQALSAYSSADESRSE